MGSGRFGNKILNILNLSLKAYSEQSMVLIPSIIPSDMSSVLDFYNNDKQLIYDKNKILLDTRIKKSIEFGFKLGHSYYFRKNNFQFPIKRSIAENLIQTYKLQQYNTNDNDLYIHIRSTDIHIQNSSNIYSQPPISFYLKIIDDFGYKNIRLVSDNNNNFIVREMKNIFGSNCTVIDEPDTRKAFDILRNCKNLCVSTSSFCTMAAFLTPYGINKNIYAYSYITNIYHHWFLSNLFGDDHIYNNTIPNFTFHIYNIKKYKYMDHCNLHSNKYTDLSDKNWWKNGNINFQHNWSFTNYTKNMLINHSINNIEQIC